MRWWMWGLFVLLLCSAGVTYEYYARLVYAEDEMMMWAKKNNLYKAKVETTYNDFCRGVWVVYAKMTAVRPDGGHFEIDACCNTQANGGCNL